MECHEDFISYLDSDTSLKILECLDDPADLVRVTCVSRSLRQSGKLFWFKLCVCLSTGASV